jgi:lysophospholipase L1-like esterase
MKQEAKSTRGRTFLFMVLTPLLTILVLALLFEVGLRIGGYNPLGHMARGVEGNSFFLKKSEDPILRFELNPGYQGVFEGARLVINARGMRGRELPEDKDGHIRIALLGDSITLAKTIPEEEIFASRLERMLQAVNPRCEVMNLGTDGYDTVQEVLSFRDKGLAFAPDVVVVCYCLNDIGITPLDTGFIQNFIQPRIPLSYRLRVWQWVNLRLRRLKAASLFKKQLESVGAFGDFYGNLFPPADKDAFLEEEFQAIAESQKAFAAAGSYDRKRTVLEHPGSLWLNQYTDLKSVGKIRYAFKELAGMADARGFKVLVAVIPFFYKVQGRYLDLPAHRIVIHQAQALGLKTADLFPMFNAAGFKGLDLDGVHLSVRGHQVMAEALFEELGRQFFPDLAKQAGPADNK